MARGCPVIAADAGALPEVVGDAGGACVEPDDVEAWADGHALRLLDDAGDARAESGVGRPARAGGFSRPLARADGTARRCGRRGRSSPRAASVRAMNLLVLCPHFAPDVAPTGEVMTSIVERAGERGHRLHIVTSLPWYQHHPIEPGWAGQLVRHEDTDWGRITRVHPFPTDKRNIPARALAFGGFTVLAALAGAARPSRARRRARHVAAAHPRARRLGRGPAPAGAVRVQHPGRVPRRRGRARAPSPTAG